MRRAHRLAAGLVLALSLLAFAATSPPSASDFEKSVANLSAEHPSLSREVELDLHLENAFEGEQISFSCGMAWEDGAEPVKVRMTVEPLDPGGEAQSAQVESSIGTQYEDGSRTPGRQAGVSLNLPCQGDGDCSARYRFTCDLPEPPPDRKVKIEWIVSARVRYDPGSLCGSGVESRLDIRVKEPTP